MNSPFYYVIDHAKIQALSIMIIVEYYDGREHSNMLPRATF